MENKELSDFIEKETQEQSKELNYNEVNFLTTNQAITSLIKIKNYNYTKTKELPRPKNKKINDHIWKIDPEKEEVKLLLNDKNGKISLVIPQYIRGVKFEKKPIYKNIYFEKLIHYIIRRYNFEKNEYLRIYFNELIDKNIFNDYKTAKENTILLLDYFTKIKIEYIDRQRNRDAVCSFITSIPIINGDHASISVNINFFEATEDTYINAPVHLDKLTSKSLSTAYLLYTHARRNPKKSIHKISVRSIAEHLGIPSPSETKRKTQEIIEPILNIINEIQTKQKLEKYKITFLNDNYLHYKNVNDFLGGIIEYTIDPVLIPKLNNKKK